MQRRQLQHACSPSVLPAAAARNLRRQLHKTRLNRNPDGPSAQLRIVGAELELRAHSICPLAISARQVIRDIMELKLTTPAYLSMRLQSDAVFVHSSVLRQEKDLNRCYA